MPSFVNRRERFISNMMSMLTDGTTNDVKIVLNDGEIFANKDVLSAGSDYFATMFSNKEIKFIEGETKTVTFSHCSKAIMEKIIQYLFSGDLELHEVSLLDLVMMMSMTTMMMLDDLKEDIQQYILEIIPRSGINYGILPELVESLMLAETLKLDTIKNAVVLELYQSLEDIPHIPDCVQNFEAFQQLPPTLLLYEDGETHESVDEILTLDDLDDPNRFPMTKARFDSFVFWLSKNNDNCDNDDKKVITESFKFHDFTVEELLTDVKKSGLYSIEIIDKRLLEKFNHQERILASTKQNLLLSIRKSSSNIEKDKTSDFAKRQRFRNNFIVKKD